MVVEQNCYKLEAMAGILYLMASSKEYTEGSEEREEMYILLCDTIREVYGNLLDLIEEPEGEILVEEQNQIIDVLRNLSYNTSIMHGTGGDERY